MNPPAVPPAKTEGSRLSIGWVGFHREGVEAFRAVAREGFDLRFLVTLDSASLAKRSDARDYGPLAAEHGVPVHRTASINAPETVAFVHNNAPDMLVVLGWSQILSEQVLACARLGTIGAHASLLPHNRGSAPVNWAIIKGEREGGNTLMWLSRELDGGNIVAQQGFPISPYDTCKSVYDKVARTNRTLLLRALRQLDRGIVPSRPQPPSTEPLLPRRRPRDGLIDWGGHAAGVYDFVRALTRPYPGAFSSIGGQTVTLWRAALPDFLQGELGRPGQVLGPVRSPSPAACGVAVACGRGALIVLEAELPNGRVLKGPRLSEVDWTGEVFGSE